MEGECPSGAGWETLTPAKMLSHVWPGASSSSRGCGGAGDTNVPAFSPACFHKEPGSQPQILGPLARLGGGGQGGFK